MRPLLHDISFLQTNIDVRVILDPYAIVYAATNEFDGILITDTQYVSVNERALNVVVDCASVGEYALSNDDLVAFLRRSLSYILHSVMCLVPK